MTTRDLVALSDHQLFGQRGMEHISDSTAAYYRAIMAPLISAARDVERTFSGTTKVRSFLSLRGGSAMTSLGLPASDIDISLRLQISTTKALKSEELSRIFLTRIFSRYLLITYQAHLRCGHETQSSSRARRRPRIDGQAAGNVVSGPPEPQFPAASSRKVSLVRNQEISYKNCKKHPFKQKGILITLESKLHFV